MFNLFSGIFERGNFMVLIVIASIGLGYVVNYWCYHGFHHEQARLRAVDRLEVELRDDLRYQNILVSRHDFKSTHMIVSVEGTVAIQEDLNSLQSLSGRYKKYCDNWNVKIAGQEEEDIADAQLE